MKIGRSVISQKLKVFLILSAGLTVIVAACVVVGVQSKRISYTQAMDDSEGSPMSISLMYPKYDNRQTGSRTVKDYVESTFDIRLVQRPESSSSYANKLRAAAASGKLTDVVVWTSFQSELLNHTRRGLFHDLTAYVESSEHLSKLPPELLENAKLDGRLFGIPRPRATVDKAVIIRKDWLDALRLPLPATIDDYYKVATSFGQDDPDGNGKKDTYGFAGGEGLSFLSELFIPFGAGNGWLMQEDGQLVASKISPGRERGLEWLRDLYQNRGIDQRFATLKTAQAGERFMQGHTGMIIAPISDYAKFVSVLREREPDAELIMLGPPEGPSGIRGFSEQPGFYGWILISSHVSSAKLERIIEWLDWQAGEEGYYIRQFGLENIHYRLDSSNQMTHLNKELLGEERLGELFLMNPFDPYLYVSVDASEEIQAKQREALDLVAGQGIKNPALTYVTETGASVASIYTRQIQQFEADYIKGKKDVLSFAEFKKEWLKRGGEKATQEVNEWFLQEGRTAGE
ncbi:extracellular solute-binding protein [Paenibacillus sp. strain BS8-2]